MVWKTLGSIANTGANVLGTVGKTGLKGAGWLTKELGKAAYNNGPWLAQQVAKGAFSVAGTAASGVYQAGTFAVKTAGGYVGFNTYVGDEVKSIDDSIQGIRDGLADSIYSGSKTVGQTASDVAEITSFIGFMPLASTLVEHLGQPLIEGSGGYLSKLVRGNRIAFVDLEVYEPGGFKAFFGAEKDVHAIMYMPKDAKSNMAGLAVMNEDALLGMYATHDENSHESKVFAEALEKVVAKKTELGLEVHTPAP